MRLRLSFLPMLLLAQVVQAAEIQTEQYQITFPDNDRVSYRGKWQTRFPNGFPMGSVPDCHLSGGMATS